MADEILVEGKSYISSKRASELTSYAQDYIGQLARKGLIDAKRIGGLWYISRESLTEYKRQAETYKPEPPQRDHSRNHNEVDSVISLDGKDYISAPRAAEITGYHQDYVGQLARGGKVLSRQVGNRWYVERAGITAHKREKDALLAAVQVEAVGIVRPKQNSAGPAAQSSLEEPFFKYTSESSTLLPLSHTEQEETDNTFELVQQREPHRVEHKVPIRILENSSVAVLEKMPTIRAASINTPSVDRGAQGAIFTRLGVGFATIVVVVTIGYVAVQKRDILYSFKGSDSAPALAGKASGVFSRAGDFLESWLTNEIVYRRSF